MRNLLPFDEDTFEVHKKAVNKKHKGDLKTHLLSLSDDVETEYHKYLENFKIKNLSVLIPNTLLAKSKAEFLELYNYKSKVIVSVRESIRNLQPKTITSTCQNCGIDSANTLDHILPKANFPEFIVNPINLFPCCSTCNSYKLDSLEDANGQKFLNLYLDELPKQQYLFVDIFLDENNDLDFKFYLKNVSGLINTKLYVIIENHYIKLHLFDRMKSKSIEYVSELENKIKSFLHRLTLEEIIEDLIVSVNNDKIAYGFNHWKCIAEIALLNSKIFTEPLRKVIP